MSFSVRIASDLVSVEAGATVPLGIEIANRSDDSDRFEMEIEGLDPDWTAVPVPTFSADPRDIQTEKIFFKPPRVSESLSGTYPFVVKVRSLNSGEQRTAQGVLEIKPYHHLTMEISPKKGVISPFKKSNAFRATIMNLGNAEHTLQFVASDPEDALAYEFEEEQVKIGPGQTKTVQIVAKPSESHPFAGTRLHGFSVSARSIEVPSVVCSSQAQLEERPALSPSVLILGLTFLIVFAGWYALIPKPPRIDSLTIQPASPLVGQEVTIEWTSSGATSAKLTVGNQVFDGLKAAGSLKYLAANAGPLAVAAQAIRDNKVSQVATRTVLVGTPEPIPDPVIERFEISPRQAEIGDPLVVRYKLGAGVTSAKLEPTGDALDPALEQLRITADITGAVTYRIVAQNSAGKTASKSVTVNVVEGSDASIVYFRVEPKELPAEGGLVTVSWQFANAERKVLNVGAEEFVLEEVTGSRDFILSAAADFKLTGYDSKGRTVSKTVRVTLRQPPTLEPNPTTGEPATTGGIR
jgi:hypothetical protein